MGLSESTPASYLARSLSLPSSQSCTDHASTLTHLNNLLQCLSRTTNTPATSLPCDRLAVGANDPTVSPHSVTDELWVSSLSIIWVTLHLLHGNSHAAHGPGVKGDSASDYIATDICSQNRHVTDGSRRLSLTPLEKQDKIFRYIVKSLDIKPSDIKLWWASKELINTKPNGREFYLTDFVGGNEKTTISVQVTNAKAQSAPRQNVPRLVVENQTRPVNESLDGDSDDDLSWMASEWANPQHLMNSLTWSSVMNNQGHKVQRPSVLRESPQNGVFNY
eukprot:GHVN01008092.1.p1 GENE.GHVN01008092.1~~GHVN01008092.1.p1  ORF type:complete len:277 (+),score=35.89 GHVN01008092.1:421-1251(+)